MMTPEEACVYLGISLDDEDLYIDVIESNYRSKILECEGNEEQKAKIDEAHTILLEVYDELYGGKSDEAGKKNNEGLLMKLAVLMAVVFLLSFAGVVYFVYRIHTESNTPQNEVISSAEYERVLRELEAIRNRQEEQPAPQIVINNPPADYATLVERVMPSMLYIETDRGRGSGFFVSPNGDILTNHHVIEGAEYIVVTAQDGQRVSALVKDYDSVRDMALLKVNTSYVLPYLKISNVLPKQGETVLAIGNPKGFSGTVSNGIVSAVRELNNNLWVQFTAPISPGSSGGALLNLNGEVVGMPTLIWVAEAAQNLNFAVPPIVLTQFLNSAISKPAKPLQAKTNIPPKTDTPPKTKHRLDSLPGAKFIRSDDGYEIYLDTESIKYDRNSKLASFITYWWPKEKSKIQMRRDPHFVINPGEDLGVCVLLYTVDFSDNTYMHLRTVNFCTNGNIARDYPRPPDERIWRTAKKGSRIASLMQAVKKQLRIR